MDRKSVGQVLGLAVGMCTLLGWTGLSSAVTIETVPVGNAGNVADTAAHSGNAAGQGAVDYSYNIGKYEVTVGQYTEFLNAKATLTDPYALYNTKMADITTYLVMGCNIQRSGNGTVGNPYSYTVGNGNPTDIVNWANRPVNYVSWYDTLRFANWLTNGQGGGDTEAGSYRITGGGANSGTVTLPTAAERKTLAAGTTLKWFLTSEDEWYKAAYYKGGGLTAGYYLYPTSSDTAPGTDLADPSPGDNANYYTYSYLLDSPYYRTEVGTFQNSASPSGTFDQGGNVYEWNEAVISESLRGMRGGWFGREVDLLRSSDRHSASATNEDYGSIGFRVSAVAVPEPASALVVLVGLIGLTAQRRRRR